MVCRIEEYAKNIYVVGISQCRLRPLSLFDGPDGVILPASALGIPRSSRYQHRHAVRLTHSRCRGRDDRYPDDGPSNAIMWKNRWHIDISLDRPSLRTHEGTRSWRIQCVNSSLLSDPVAPA